MCAKSKRRLNDCDKLRYPKGYEVKTVSESGHFGFEGRSYHLGEAFAGQRVGLRQSALGQLEVHFANVHLGHLAYGSDGGRFRPSAYIAPLRSKTLDIVKR